MYLVKTADEAFHLAMESCFNGVQLESRVGGSQEATAFSFKLLDPKSNLVFNKRRAISPAYAAAELIWYMRQTEQIDMIEHYAPQYRKFAPDGKAQGAYGPRLCGDEAKDALIELEANPNSRRACIALFTELFGHSLDVPCTQGLQLLIRDGKLNVICTMRSNDVWLGLPYDLFCFTTLQQIWAETLGVDVGWYVHQVGSMHLYDKNRKAAMEAVQSLDFETGPFWDEPMMTSGYSNLVKTEQDWRTGRATNLGLDDSMESVLMRMVMSHNYEHPIDGVRGSLIKLVEQFRNK